MIYIIHLSVFYPLHLYLNSDYFYQYNNIDLFLNFNVLETVVQCESYNNPTNYLSQSLMSNKQYIYIGEKLPDDQLLKCQMFAKMRIDYIVCQQNNKTIGYFLNQKIIKDFWIYYLSKDTVVEFILNLKQSKLIVPIFV